MPVKKKVNSDFFKQWSSEMAYVLGFFAADGNMVASKRSNYYLSFYNADRDILAKMLRVMESDHKLSQRLSSTGVTYRFQIGDKSMHGDLLSLGFTSNKASRMIMPKIPQAFMGDFVRGYFDGDGNVWVGFLNKRRKTPTFVLQASFTSGSRDFLMGLHRLLLPLGIKGGAIYTSKSKAFFRLQFSTLDSLKLAEIMYNNEPKLFLKRKWARFQEFRVKYKRS